MKTSLTVLIIFLCITSLGQDTNNSTEPKAQKKPLTAEQLQFQRDVIYVVRNAKRAYENIDRVDSSIGTISKSVNQIVTSNQKLWEQNDSLKVIQNRILLYARQAEDRALKAEAESLKAKIENKEWDKMLDLSVLFGAIGAIVILLGVNIYNTYQLSRIKSTLIV